MAQQADGTVYINSSIDTNGVDVGGKKIESAFKRAANSVKSSIGSIKSGMQSINQAMSTNLNTSGFDTIQDKVDSISDHLKSLEGQGLGFGDSEYDRTYQQLVLAENELKQYKTTLAETAMAEQNAAQYTGVLQSVLNVLAGAAHAPVSMLQMLGSSIKQFPHATLNLVASGLNKISSVAKNAAKMIGSGLVSGLKKAGSAMLGFHKNTQKANGSLGGGLKTILQYALGLRGLYAVFSKVKSAIKEGFQNLAQYSEETNASLSALKSSATQLKNSLATAFNPLLTVIAPVLTRFIDLLSQAITYVGMFFAALTGRKSFTKAAKVQQNYADSLGKTADNAKKATKYLSGLDEIRTYSEEKDTSLGGGAGGISPADMFEDVNIPDFIKDWADKFKKAWENADFTEIGAIVGTKLRDALSNIPWGPVKATCNKIAQSLATFINGFVATPGLWEIVGVTIGESINTATGMWNTFFDVTNFIALGAAIATALNNAFQTIDAKALGKALSQKIRAFIEASYGFVTTFDWSAFGALIGLTIIGFFSNIDFALAAQTLSEGIIGAFNSLTAAIAEVDWYALGEQVKEFLVNIDWAGVADAMFEALGAGFGGFASFLAGLITDGLLSAQEYFQQKIEEAGGNIAEGILMGIAEALVGIGNWIVQNIFNPFIEGFKKAFGIHSPSTVMEEQGRYIMLGLFNGLSVLVGKVVSIFTSLKEAIKTPINGIIGFINSMISGIVAGINSITSLLNGLKIDIPDWIPRFGGKTFGFNLPTFTAPQIPYLATGAVIPPNAPFMAVLGDQKNGKNLEMPENLLRQIVREESGNNGMNGTIRIPIIINGRQILEAVVDAAKLQQTVSGNNPLAFT